MSEYVKRLRPRVTLEATRRLSSSTELKRVLKKSKIGEETGKKKQRHKKTGKGSRKISSHPTLVATNSKDQVAPILDLPKAFEGIQEKEENEKKVRRLKHKRTKGEVHDFLQSVGVEDLDSVCLCLKAGIKNKWININGPKPLENVILVGNCCSCEAELTVKLGDVLYQGASGGSYWGGSDTDVQCPNEDCDVQFVVSDMCTPFPQLSDGKFYNHCDLCPGFGECIGDYRHSHCMSCGEHYFAGSMDQFKCSTCYSSDMEDDGFGGILPYGPPRSVKNSIFSFLYRELEHTKFDLLQDLSGTDLGQGEHFVLEATYSSESDYETEKMT